MRAFTVSSTAVARCPIHSLSPRHYRDDGTCPCRGDTESQGGSPTTLPPGSPPPGDQP